MTSHCLVWVFYQAGILDFYPVVAVVAAAAAADEAPERREH